MRSLRYSINITLDGCCDHRAGTPNEELHRYTVESLARADALLFGRLTYQLMEAGWRQPATTARPEWTEPFARMINAAKKYVVSSTLDSVDWNAELIRGDLKTAVQQLKREPGNGLYVGGVQLPLALAEMGLIDEYEFFVHPKLAGHGPTPFAGLSKPVDLKLVGQREFGSGAVALRYEVVGPRMVLVEVDDEVLARLVRAATEGAAPDEVTPPLTPGQTWTPERVAWLRAFHRDRRAGIDGAAAEVTWAVVLEEAVVGSVRLRRTEEPDALELGVWLTRDVRGRGLGRSIMAQVVEQAKALGAVRLQADTTSGNAPALAVLRELGFTVTPGGGSHEVHADLALT